jgi:hypothetical protein
MHATGRFGAGRTHSAQETASQAKRRATLVRPREALWCFVVHDLNPRGLSLKVTGFAQARSWQQDLTRVELF